MFAVTIHYSVQFHIQKTSKDFVPAWTRSEGLELAKGPKDSGPPLLYGRLPPG